MEVDRKKKKNRHTWEFQYATHEQDRKGIGWRYFEIDGKTWQPDLVGPRWRSTKIASWEVI